MELTGACLAPCVKSTFEVIVPRLFIKSAAPLVLTYHSSTMADVKRNESKVATESASTIAGTKPIRFLDLPKEISLLIYESLEPRGTDFYNCQFTICHQLDTELLRTCHLIRSEVQPLLLRSVHIRLRISRYMSMEETVSVFPIASRHSTAAAKSCSSFRERVCCRIGGPKIRIP